MIKVSLTQPRKNRVTIVARRGEEPILLETVSAGDGRAIGKIARRLGCDETQLLSAVLRIADGPQYIDVDEPEPEKLEYRVRPISGSESQRFLDFNAALATGAKLPESIIEWKGTERTCCLDIDYHGRAPPDAEWLLRKLSSVQPQPHWMWLSRGGGAHLIYHQIGDYNADELACVAGISWLSVDRSAEYDLCASSRSPTGPVYQRTASADMSAIGAYIGSDLGPEQVADYLSDCGLELGRSYPHAKCPLRPGVESHGTPVFCGDHGISCHSCAAGGHVLGSKKPGFFPYTALCGGGVPSVIRHMARRFCHYEHARIVLDDQLGLRGEQSRLAWRAILHLLHGNDPRVDKAMSAGRNLIRLDRRWTTRDAISTYTKDIGAIIGALPSCQDKEGAAVGETVQRFLQPIDLDEEGYPSITPIVGCRIYSHYMSLPDERISVVTPTRALRAHTMADRRPRYAPGDLDMAWRVIERAFPKIDHNYLLLCIAAKGFVESGIGLPPNIICCGPSSTGKTSIPHIAAAIAGDRCTDIVWQNNSERFRQSVAAAVEVGSYVCVSEILKEADRLGYTAQQVMDIFLTLTPESLTHKLYVGPLPMGRSPVCIVTDITVPQALRNDLQLGRRFVYVRLEDRVDWVSSVADTGIFQYDRFRLADEAFCEAGNTVVSHVIDRFFRKSLTLFEIAEQLGYSTLDKATGFDDPLDELRKFYELVTTEPESQHAKFIGDGWRVVKRGDETPLADLWASLCDGSEPGRWGTSRRVAEQDWKALIGKPVRPEIKRHGAVVGFRFIEG